MLFTEFNQKLLVYYVRIMLGSGGFVTDAVLCVYVTCSALIFLSSLFVIVVYSAHKPVN